MKNHKISKDERVCASCGKILKQSKYGIDKACPYCNKQTAVANIKSFHVLFNNVFSNIGLYANLGDLGIDYECAILNYMLTVGDISSPPFSNEEVYWHNRCKLAEEIEEQIKEQFNKISKLSKKIPVYLWCDEYEINEVLNLYYFAPLIFDHFDNIYLVNFGDDGIPKLKNEIKLELKDINEMKQELQKCQTSDSYIRLFTDDGITNYTREYFESVVLSEINNEFQGFVMSISLREKASEKYGFFPNFDDLRETIYGLSQKGIIESDSGYALWNFPGEKAKIIDKKFRLAQKKQEKLSLKEVLLGLKDAMVYGATYLVYNFLAENIVLDCQGNEIIGRDNVISYIEKRGMYHYYIEKEKIVGGLVEIDGGADNGLLIVYVTDAYKSPFVVTIDYDGKYINKISIERPNMSRIKPIH